MTTRTLFTVATQRLMPPQLEGDVGCDLPSLGSYLIQPGELIALRTGINVQLPEDCWGLIIARSGTNNAGQLVVLPGVIDPGFRGELLVYARNLSHRRVVIKEGTALAQLILIPAVRFKIEHVLELEESERGTQGFGSTGH